MAAALAVLAGGAWALAAPPQGWWPLLPLGAGLLALSLAGRSAWHRLALASVVAVRWWALPAALVLLEAVQARVPLGGFPLPGLAPSQPDGPFVLAAPLGGSLLVVGAATTAGVALAALWLLPTARSRAAAAGEPGGFRNAAVAYGTAGMTVDRYEKEHRVPFGEYVPARRLLSRFTDATALVPKDAIVGRGTARLDLPQGPVDVVTSYEVFFSDRVREAVRAGGRLVVVPTNASSYVGEQVPATELATARLRAREFGRAVLQAAPTGYSAIVLQARLRERHDPQGLRRP